MTNPPLVETHGLSIHFGGLKAVNNVNFSLRDGELRCLIGPNGAGKTTFFRLLTGVHAPTFGTVKISGRSIVGLQTHQIAKLGVGIKTQIPSLFDNLSVHENIWLSARRNHSRAAANQIAERGSRRRSGSASTQRPTRQNCLTASANGSSLESSLRSSQS